MSDLRQAAQQALEAWDDPMKDLKDMCVAMDAIRTALEQQQAEPVAWTTMPEAEDWCFVSGGKDPTSKLEGKWFPLYTTPPQRKPLTDELYNELFFSVGKKYPNETRHQTALRYIRQAEMPSSEPAKAAHGIKETP